MAGVQESMAASQDLMENGVASTATVSAIRPTQQVVNMQPFGDFLKPAERRQRIECCRCVAHCTVDIGGRDDAQTLQLDESGCLNQCGPGQRCRTEGGVGPMTGPGIVSYPARTD